MPLNANQKKNTVLNLEAFENGNILRKGTKEICSGHKWKRDKKLKEYSLKKNPREERDKILLVATGNEIVWVVGNKTSDKFKVNENTKYILKLEFKDNAECK